MSNLTLATLSPRSLSHASAGGALARPPVAILAASELAAPRGVFGGSARFDPPRGPSDTNSSIGPLSLGQGIGDLSDRLRWLKLGVCAVVILNVVDAIFTLVWVQAGLATEANPLLAPIVGMPLVFMVAKLAAVSVGAAVFWRHLARPISTFAVCVANTAYLAVCFYHLAFLAEPVV